MLNRATGKKKSHGANVGLVVCRKGRGYEVHVMSTDCRKTGKTKSGKQGLRKREVSTEWLFVDARGNLLKKQTARKQ